MRRRIGLILAVVLAGALVAVTVGLASAKRGDAPVAAAPPKPAAAFTYDPGGGRDGRQPDGADLGEGRERDVRRGRAARRRRARPSTARCPPTARSGRPPGGWPTSSATPGRGPRPGRTARRARWRPRSTPSTPTGRAPRHAEHRRRQDRRRRRADRDPVQRARRRPGRGRAGPVGADLGAGRGRVGLAARRGRRLARPLPDRRSTGRRTRRSRSRRSSSASTTAAASSGAADMSSTFTIGRAQIVKADVNSHRHDRHARRQAGRELPGQLRPGRRPRPQHPLGGPRGEREVHRQADGQRAVTTTTWSRSGPCG